MTDCVIIPSCWNIILSRTAADINITIVQFGRNAIFLLTTFRLWSKCFVKIAIVNKCRWYHCSVMSNLYHQYSFISIAIMRYFSRFIETLYGVKLVILKNAHFITFHRLNHRVFTSFLHKSIFTNVLNLIDLTWKFEERERIYYRYI